MIADTSSAKLIDKCLISDGDVEKILDLGMHPYADTFINESQLGMTEPVFPLECYLCPESGQIQLGYISSDFERYNLYAYSYTSSNSSFSRSHWDDYYKTMVARFDLKNKFIVEIGSNDGYLIQQFKLTNKVLGVDPSKAMAEIAGTQYDVETVNDFFTSASGQQIKTDFEPADLIIANNVFNHSNDPLDFAKGVHHLLKNEGVFVFESPYWLDTIQSQHFDQIYHEHVSYFTVKSAYNLLSKVGLEIFDIEHVDYHGGSIRVYSRKIINDAPRPTDQVTKMINQEIELGLFDIDTYKKFQKDITITRDQFLEKLYSIKSQGSPIVAVGAAAKGNTLLNFYNLDKTVIDFVTDSSEHKQGKYTPLTRIPIVGDEIFAEYKQGVYALVLSWNIGDILKENLLNINNKIKFL
ncbi:class I SAM-dependent methyltransferase [Patescibacteria group bacterium]|nr:class I SAM-dependent methyltransferase [Patescibacteria group bacterium]